MIQNQAMQSLMHARPLSACKLATPLMPDIPRNQGSQLSMQLAPARQQLVAENILKPVTTRGAHLQATSCHPGANQNHDAG